MKVIKKGYLRFIAAVTMFWKVLTDENWIFYKNTFQMLTDLLSLILETANSGKHHITKMAVIHPDGEEQEIVTIWAGAGVNSSYHKRVTELVDENKKLKRELSKLISEANNTGNENANF